MVATATEIDDGWSIFIGLTPNDITRLAQGEVILSTLSSMGVTGHNAGRYLAVTAAGKGRSQLLPGRLVPTHEDEVAIILFVTDEQELPRYPKAVRRVTYLRGHQGQQQRFVVTCSVGDGTALQNAPVKHRFHEISDEYWGGVHVEAASTYDPSTFVHPTLGILRKRLTVLGVLGVCMSIAALSWVTALSQTPALAAQTSAMWITCAIIGRTFGACSLALVAGDRRILVIPNLVQLPLFCVLSYQLFSAFGPQHFRFEREPVLWDWIELTAVHCLHAADVLDALEAYKIDLLNLEHHSVAAGAILVWMHVTVDIFVFALVLRYGKIVLTRFRGLERRRAGFWSRKNRGQRLQWFYIALGFGLIASAVAVLRCGVVECWPPLDGLVWPLENVLRTIDFGDCFNIFRWRWYHVEGGFWTATVTVIFRLFVGAVIARWIYLVRVVRFRGIGLSEEDIPQDRYQKLHLVGEGGEGQIIRVWFWCAMAGLLVLSLLLCGINYLREC